MQEAFPRVKTESATPAKDCAATRENASLLKPRVGWGQSGLAPGPHSLRRERAVRSRQAPAPAEFYTGVVLEAGGGGPAELRGRA